MSLHYDQKSCEIHYKVMSNVIFGSQANLDGIYYKIDDLERLWTVF